MPRGKGKPKTIRYAFVELDRKKKETGRVLFYYSSQLRYGPMIEAIKKEFGHTRYRLEEAGKINHEGRLVDVPEKWHSKLLADHVPARETRK